MAIVIICLVCLLAGLIPSLIADLVDFALAVSIFIAIGCLTYAVTTVLYTKRYAYISIGALLVGTLFYASCVIRYTFGIFSREVSLAALVQFPRVVYSNQRTHGAAMLVLGLGMVFVMGRSIIKSKERQHTEKVMEYLFICLGVIQIVIGALALFI